ncbi:hypothetical protein JKP88DRAFT_248896 [Tribonema minus]|uniref:Uncharacterized protein n=1 Tax=Tribonema minus TaxID=303371 RepID=A0A836C9J0_9STRA|nr:hypothetical protein JKP88DRAFT_248896 [Tribonema minus]
MQQVLAADMAHPKAKPTLLDLEAVLAAFIEGIFESVPQFCLQLWVFLNIKSPATKTLWQAWAYVSLSLSLLSICKAIGLGLWRRPELLRALQGQQVAGFVCIANGPYLDKAGFFRQHFRLATETEVNMFKDLLLEDRSRLRMQEGFIAKLANNKDLVRHHPGSHTEEFWTRESAPQRKYDAGETSSENGLAEPS